MKLVLRQRALRLVVLASPLLFGACAADEAAPVAGPEVEIQTSPITYPGIANVCFALEVFNGQPGPGTDTVWSKEHLCSDQFGSGAGGAISYVGPCDAGVDGDNYVALTLETITVDGGQTLDDQTGGGIGFDGADFQNPCTATDRCYLHFECKANADVKVAFDLTVMRDANQGFFDIGVAFDDVFCAAKVDTCTAPSTPITLLGGDDQHDPVGLDRTAVAAVACTAGPDGYGHDFATNLLFTTKTVACTDPVGNAVTFAIDATDHAEGDVTAASTTGDFTLHYANYFGAEQLVCGGYLQLQDGTQDLELTCGDGICHIHGASAANNWAGYGFPPDPGAGAGGYGGYGGYGGVGGQQQQQQAGAGFGAFYYQGNSASNSGIGGLGYGGYGAGAGAGAVALVYLDADGNVVDDPDLDGNGRVIGWDAIVDTLSCNKTFYNTAIDVENLAGQGLANCALSFDATALASDDAHGFDAATGTFTHAGGLYGAVHVPSVPLTGAGAGDSVNPVCNAAPLDGSDLYESTSLVHTKYIGTLVDDNPAFCFHSDDGGVLQHLAGCGEDVIVIPPVDCPDTCTTCAPGTAVSLQCADNGTTYMCDLSHAAPETLAHLFIGEGSGSIAHIAALATDGDGHASFAGDSGYGFNSFFYVLQNNQAIANTINAICVDCAPGYQRNDGGLCVACSESCLECSGFTCNECANGYHLDGGQCVIDDVPDVVCPDHCAACNAWDVTLVCVQDMSRVICTVSNAPGDAVLIWSDALQVNQQIDLVAGGGSTTFQNASVHSVFGAYGQVEPGAIFSLIATNEAQCKECDEPYALTEYDTCGTGGPQ